jgi:UDP-N-acetylmuramate--alanine ligase
MKGLYFSGIAGSGMSALALFMARKGYRVSGSDRIFDRFKDHPLTSVLKEAGIVVTPQEGSGIDHKIDLSVFSTAIEGDHPDYLKAKALKIPTKTRPELLADLVSQYKTVAIAGTSGKSTTSGMLAYLMESLGLEPNFIGGGRVRQFRDRTNQGNFLYGNSDRLIIEACESDGSIVNYHPETTVLLNLDLDHHSIQDTLDLFKGIIRNTSKRVIINKDDKNLAPLLSKTTVTFAIEGDAHYRAEAVFIKDLHSDFKVRGTDFRLNLPGRYNLINALACIAYLSEIGVGLKDIAAVLPNFTGIERRFEIHLNSSHGLVIDDYAHNPHKIASMMHAASYLNHAICYIFQPHGFGPTRLMKDAYIETFIKALRAQDHLILLPIYYAGGTATMDISSDDIARGVRVGGRSVEVVVNRDDVLKKIGQFRAFVVFGARDDSLSGLASKIAEALKRS